LTDLRIRCVVSALSTEAARQLRQQVSNHFTCFHIIVPNMYHHHDRGPKNMILLTIGNNIVTLLFNWRKPANYVPTDKIHASIRIWQILKVRIQRILKVSIQRMQILTSFVTSLLLIIFFVFIISLYLLNNYVIVPTVTLSSWYAACCRYNTWNISLGQCCRSPTSNSTAVCLFSNTNTCTVRMLSAADARQTPWSRYWHRHSASVMWVAHSFHSFLKVLELSQFSKAWRVLQWNQGPYAWHGHKR